MSSDALTTFSITRRDNALLKNDLVSILTVRNLKRDLEKNNSHGPVSVKIFSKNFY